MERRPTGAQGWSGHSGRGMVTTPALPVLEVRDHGQLSALALAWAQARFEFDALHFAEQQQQADVFNLLASLRAPLVPAGLGSAPSAAWAPVGRLHRGRAWASVRQLLPAATPGRSRTSPACGWLSRHWLLPAQLAGCPELVGMVA